MGGDGFRRVHGVGNQRHFFSACKSAREFNLDVLDLSTIGNSEEVTDRGAAPQFDD
jgi:hypothetical protein